MPDEVQSTYDAEPRIRDLERRHLDGTKAPAAPPVWGQIERVPFVRILGQAAFWEGSAHLAYEQRLDGSFQSISRPDRTSIWTSAAPANRAENLPAPLAFPVWMEV